MAGVSHPFAEPALHAQAYVGGGMMRFVGSWPVWSIRTRDRAVGGGHDLHDRAPTKRTGGGGRASCGPPVQRADLPVAQRVVDVLELAAGRGHGGDVLPAAGRDPFA